MRDQLKVQRMNRGEMRWTLVGDHGPSRKLGGLLVAVQSCKKKKKCHMYKTEILLKVLFSLVVVSSLRLSMK